METSPRHDERVMQLVAEARRQSPAEREAFLRQECETDPILYQEVADTLKWDDRMGSFLQVSSDYLLDNPSGSAHCAWHVATHSPESFAESRFCLSRLFLFFGAVCEHAHAQSLGT
jgi:hypothetical protein